MYYQQVDSKQMPRTVDSIRSISNNYEPHRQLEEQEQRHQPMLPPSLHQQQLQHQMPQLQLQLQQQQQQQQQPQPQQAQQQQQPYLPPEQLHNQIYQQNLLQHQLSVIQQHFQAFQMQKQDQHDPLYSYQAFQRPNCYEQLEQPHHKQSPQQQQHQHIQAAEISPRPNQQLLRQLHQQLHSSGSPTTKRNRDHNKRTSKDSDSQASSSSPELGGVQQSGRIKRSGRANRADGKPKRVRTIFTPEQLRRLEHFFSNKSYLVAGDRNNLADELCLTGAQVKVWFQNRRIKERRLKPGVTTPVPMPDES